MTMTSFGCDIGNTLSSFKIRETICIVLSHGVQVSIYQMFSDFHSFIKKKLKLNMHFYGGSPVIDIQAKLTNTNCSVVGCLSVQPICNHFNTSIFILVQQKSIHHSKKERTVESCLNENKCVPHLKLKRKSSSFFLKVNLNSKQTRIEKNQPNAS